MRADKNGSNYHRDGSWIARRYYLYVYLFFSLSFVNPTQLSDNPRTFISFRVSCYPHHFLAIFHHCRLPSSFCSPFQLKLLRFPLKKGNLAQMKHDTRAYKGIIKLSSILCAFLPENIFGAKIKSPSL